MVDAPRNREERVDRLDPIPEDGADGAENEDKRLDAMELPNKPSYFNMFDEEEVDSEEELVAGENNYIEIDCLPLEGQPRPAEEVKQAAAAAPEEEKKEAIAEDRSSQYKGSEDDNKEEKKDAAAAANDIVVPADPAKAEEKPADAQAKEEGKEEKKEEAKEEKKEEAKEEAKEEVKAAPVVYNNSADDDDTFCRFCWDGANVIENPLLSVCKCSGGVGYVHYICLKYWLKTKQSENRTFTSWTIYWRTFGCEICHQIYPYVFKANNRKYSLIDI